MSKKEPSKQEPMNDDCIEELYNKRIIFIDKEITAESSSTWISQIIALDLQNNKPIIILINSTGGDVYSTLAMVDIMESVKSPVYTVATGLAASCAALILACGNKRFATPNSAVMIHQIWTSYEEIKVKDLIMVEAKELGRIHETFVDKFVQKTKMDRDKVELIHGKDSYFSSKQALDAGIIDEIGWKLQEWTK